MLTRIGQKCTVIDHRWIWGLQFSRLGEGNYFYLLTHHISYYILHRPTKRDEAGEDIASSGGCMKKQNEVFLVIVRELFVSGVVRLYVFHFSFFFFPLFSFFSLFFFPISILLIYISPHPSNLNLCSIYPGRHFCFHPLFLLSPQKSVHSMFMFIFVLFYWCIREEEPMYTYFDLTAPALN